MSKNQYFAVQAVLLVICVVLFTEYVVFMFKNAELTSTQVLIEKWPHFLGVIGCLIVSQTIRVKFYKKLFQR